MSQKKVQRTYVALDDDDDENGQSLRKVSDHCTTTRVCKLSIKFVLQST
jgi:hypothetical protein